MPYSKRDNYTQAAIFIGVGGVYGAAIACTHHFFPGFYDSMAQGLATTGLGGHELLTALTVVVGIGLALGASFIPKLCMGLKPDMKVGQRNDSSEVEKTLDKGFKGARAVGPAVSSYEIPSPAQSR